MTVASDLRSVLTCALSHPEGERVQLGHGSGGRLSAALFRDRFLPHFRNPELERLGDGAVLHLSNGRGSGTEVVFSTDTFVVSPLEFPGGNIGSLAVHGTVNDLAMMGGTPQFLSAGFVLEEGLPFDLLDRIVESMGEAAREAGVVLVTGDTKVVERGKADGLYVNTTGIGVVSPEFRPAPDRAREGDAVLVSGPIGRHGMAIMAAREDLGLRTTIESDSASLFPLVTRLRDALGDEVRVLRDATRGGVASALNEIAAASGVGISLGADIPIPPAVHAACEMLGLDPLYVANEGVLVVLVPSERAAEARDALRGHPLGREAAIIGRAVGEHPGMVVMRTGLGGSRIVDLLPGDQLPRIC